MSYCTNTKVPPSGERITRYTDLVVARKSLTSVTSWHCKVPTWTRTSKGKKLFKIIGLCIKSGGYVDYKQTFEDLHRDHSLERATVTLYWNPEK